MTGRWAVAVALFVYCATAGADRAVTPISVCQIPDRAPYAAMQPQQVHFTNVAAEAGLMERQCFIRTTPNCLFRQYDPKLKRWDKFDVYLSVYSREGLENAASNRDDLGVYQ